MTRLSYTCDSHIAASEEGLEVERCSVSTTGFTGVYQITIQPSERLKLGLDGATQFFAEPFLHGKKVHLGYFPTASLAAVGRARALRNAQQGTQQASSLMPSNPLALDPHGHPGSSSSVLPTPQPLKKRQNAPQRDPVVAAAAEAAAAAMAAAQAAAMVMNAIAGHPIGVPPDSSLPRFMRTQLEDKLGHGGVAAVVAMTSVRIQHGVADKALSIASRPSSCSPALEVAKAAAEAAYQAAALASLEPSVGSSSDAMAPDQSSASVMTSSVGGVICASTADSVTAANDASSGDYHRGSAAAPPPPLLQQSIDPSDMPSHLADKWPHLRMFHNPEPPAETLVHAMSVADIATAAALSAAAKIKAAVARATEQSSALAEAGRIRLEPAPNRTGFKLVQFRCSLWPSPYLVSASASNDPAGFGVLTNGVGFTTGPKPSGDVLGNFATAAEAALCGAQHAEQVRLATESLLGPASHFSRPRSTKLTAPYERGIQPSHNWTSEKKHQPRLKGGKLLQAWASRFQNESSSAKALSRRTASVAVSAAVKVAALPSVPGATASKRPKLMPTAEPAVPHSVPGRVPVGGAFRRACLHATASNRAVAPPTCICPPPTSKYSRLEPLRRS